MIDLNKVGEITKRHGLLLVVDASQTAGVWPVDVQEQGIDVLCLPGTKGCWDRRGQAGCMCGPALISVRYSRAVVGLTHIIPIIRHRCLRRWKPEL